MPTDHHETTSPLRATRRKSCAHAKSCLYDLSDPDQVKPLRLACQAPEAILALPNPEYAGKVRNSGQVRAGDRAKTYGHRLPPMWLRNDGATPPYEDRSTEARGDLEP